MTGAVVSHSAEVDTVVQCAGPIDLVRTMALLRRGPGDPCHFVAPDRSVWRVSRFDSGPVTYHLQQCAADQVRVRCWGAGSAEFAATCRSLVGADDDPAELPRLVAVLRTAGVAQVTDAALARVQECAQRLPGLRVVATKRVLEAAIPGVLEQRVTGKEAFAAWRVLVTLVQVPAPGPVPKPMFVPPSVAQWQAIAPWQWHRAGVDPQRVAAIRRLLPFAGKLEAAAKAQDQGLVYRVLQTVPGVGVWTASQVGHRALGDADAAPYGDYHLGRVVGWSLLGRVIAHQEAPAVLAPFAPQRFRLVHTLLNSPGSMPPRRGARITIQDHRRH